MILLFFVISTRGQEIVEKNLVTNLEKIVIELDLIDHLELFNSDNDREILVHAEGSGEKPVYDLKEEKGYVLLRDVEQFSEESVLDQDKVCMVEPNYTTYRVYVPRDRELYVSVIEGNLYSSDFAGVLDVKMERGIIKLSHINGSVKVKLNSGSIYIRDLENTRVDAATNLGVITGDLGQQQREKYEKKFLETVGKPEHSLLVRTVMANIFLYGPKD